VHAWESLLRTEPMIRDLEQFILSKQLKHWKGYMSPSILITESRSSLSKGLLGRLYAFGSAQGYQAKINRAQSYLQKAMDAFMLNASADIQGDVAKAIELLPKMDMKLDGILDNLKELFKSSDLIDSKADRLLEEKQRKSEKEIKRNAHARLVSSLSIPF
jgi:hypothetical protein